MNQGFIITAFQKWLGSDIFSNAHNSRYIAAYYFYMGRAAGDLGNDCEQDLASLFASTDAWACKRLAPWLADGPKQHRVLLPVAESRDSWSGLRRGHLVPPVSLASADEDALRQVPGIGAVSARRIVKDREARGPCDAVEDLLARECLSREALALCVPYVATATSEVMEPSEPHLTGFASYVRARHAVLNSSNARDLDRVAIDELEGALRSGLVARYWELSRKPQDPGLLSIREGECQRLRLLETKQEVLAAPLDSESYVKILKRMLPKAAEKIWVQVPSLSVLHIASLRWMLDTLADAAMRRVDVRVFYDPDYKPGTILSDDVAYLRARHVPCRGYPRGARQHARVVVIDGDHVICGSQSWSASSVYHSEELSFYIRSRQLVDQHAERFDTLWQEAATTGSERSTP